MHVNGLGSGINRQMQNQKWGSNSAAITAEEMSRFGSRLSSPRPHVPASLVPIGLPLWLTALWTNENREGGSGPAPAQMCLCVCEDSGGLCVRGSHEAVRSGPAKVSRTWAQIGPKSAQFTHKRKKRMKSPLFSPVGTPRPHFVACVARVRWNEIGRNFKLQLVCRTFWAFI